MFIQLMPIVVLILVSILSQMMVSPPPYSLYSRPYVYSHTLFPQLLAVSSETLWMFLNLPRAAQASHSCYHFDSSSPFISSRSTGQTVKRQTENLHIDYYVTRDFKSEFKGSALQQIEKNVEEDYVSNVRNNCWKERQTSESPWS